MRPWLFGMMAAGATVVVVGCQTVTQVLEIGQNTSFSSGMQALNSGDYPLAFSTLKPLAEDDSYSFSGTAQLAIAEMYEKGQGVPKNKRLALEWYRRCAVARPNNSAEASCAFSLGFAYYTGEGVEEDPREAARWLQRSVDAGGQVRASLKT